MREIEVHLLPIGQSKKRASYSENHKRDAYHVHLSLIAEKD